MIGQPNKSQKSGANDKKAPATGTAGQAPNPEADGNLDVPPPTPGTVE